MLIKEKISFFVLWVLLGFGGTLFFLPEALAQFEKIESRMYKAKYRKIQEFKPLVQALLSKKGNITESLPLNMMVVNDYPSNLSMVDSLFAIQDKPLKQLEIKIQLIRASKVEDNPIELNRPKITDLISKHYDFNSFEEVDDALIQISEKRSTSFTLGTGEYSVSFRAEYGVAESEYIHLEDFILQSITSTIRGVERKVLVETSVNIINGNTEIINAVKEEKSAKTLIVIVRAIVTS